MLPVQLVAQLGNMQIILYVIRVMMQFGNA